MYMTYVNSKLQQRLKSGKDYARSPAGRKLGKTFPDTWITGPDPWLHDQYYAWHKHRSQAIYRGEGYEFTWEDWQHFWFQDDAWQRRGRGRDSLVLTRIDPDLPWHRDNCTMMTRLEHLRQKARKSQTGIKRGNYKKRRTSDGNDHRL